MANKKIIYNIGFNVDNTNLKTIETELNRIAKAASFKSLKFSADTSDIEREFKDIQASAEALGKALEASYNPKINSINIQKFNESLEQSGVNLKKIATDLQKVDDGGVQSFRNLTAELLTTQKEVKQTSKLLDSMATTFFNTVKWSISSSVLNTFTGAVQNAWRYSQKLDESLNDIRIVTGKSNEEMEKFAKNANRAAKDLKAGTTNYTNAALIYYQQGLGEEDVAARASVTVKAANVTGQSSAEVSEQLTAVWNGYKVVAEEAELYVDKLAAVAATTAADLEELSTGMSKVASAASTMGVDVDQLSAQLATIVSVTRQDASVVGTALKTIYARMGDLKVSGVDEFGTSLGDVSGQLKQMGIDVLDQEGNLRDMGEVIEEVAEKWGTWTDAQQQAAAVAIAGKRQYNNLIALFENWDMYESAKGTSQTSAGTLQKQQDIYADSLEAKLKGISTATERVYDALFDSESMKDLLDDIAKLIDKFGSFTEAIGGGGNLLSALGTIGLRVFNEQITKGITNTITNLGIMKKNLDENRARLEILDEYKDILEDPNGKDKSTIEKMVKIREQELKYSKYLSDEEKKQLELSIKQTAEIENQKDAEKKKFEEAEKFYKKQFNAEVGDPSRVKSRQKGGVQIDTRKKAVQLLRDQADELVGVDTDELSNLFAQRKQKDKEGLFIDPKSISQTDFELMEQRKETLSKQSKLSKSEKDELNLLDKKILAKKADIEIEKKIQKLTSENSKLNSAAKNKLIDLYKEGKVTEEKLIEILGEASDYYALQAKVIEENADKTKELNKSAEDIDKTNKKIFDAQKIKVFTSELVNLTSSVMGVVSGINMISNVSKIVADDSLSEMEKLEQGFQAVSSGIATMAPGVINSINTIRTAGEGAGAGIQKAFGWISLVGMALTAVIAIGKHIYDSMDHRSELEKAQEQFEAVSTAAENAKERLSDLRDEYNGLMQDISQYRDAKTAIDEMRVGTEEWQTAVENLNQQVEDLLNKYPELREAFKKDEFGVYQIDEKLVSQIAEEQRKAISAQELTVAGMNLVEKKEYENLVKEENKTRLNNISDKDNIVVNDSSIIFRNIGKGGRYNYRGQVYSNYYFQDENEAAALKRIFGDIGSTSEIKTGDLISEKQYSIDLSAIQDLSKDQIEILKSNIQSNENINESTKNIYLKYIEAIENNKSSLDSATEETEKLRDAYLSSIAENNNADGVVYTNIVKTLGIETVDPKYTPITDYIQKNQFIWNGEVVDKEGVGSKIDANSQNDVRQVQDWIKTVVKDTYGEKAASSIIYGTLGDLAIDDLGSHKITVNGEEITIDQMLQQYAINQATEKNKENTEDILPEIEQLVSSGKIAEAAYYNSSIMKDTSFDWTGATLANLATIAGYGEQYSEKANVARDALIAEIQEILTGDSNGAVDNIAAYSELTEEQVKHLKNSVDKAGLVVGGDVIKQLVDSIRDPQQMLELQQLLDGVDWTNADSVNQFRTGLIEAGIDTTRLADQWETFINNVNSGIKQWINNSKKVEENLAFIRDTIKEIEMGSLISDEEYKKMIAINPDVAKYFIKTAGGMIAIANGKDIEGILKEQYSDLGAIQNYFYNITQAVKKSVGDAFLTRDKVNDKDSVLAYTGKVSDDSYENFANIAVALGLGTNLEYIKELISKAEVGDSNAISLLGDMIMAVNQARLDVSNGEYDSSKAFEIYATSVANSWKEVNEREDFNKLDSETQKTITNYWKTTYLNELGLSSLTKELINEIDISKLEKAAIAAKDIELKQFLQDAKKEWLDFTQKYIRESNLLDQITGTEAYSNAVKQYDLAAQGFLDIFESFSDFNEISKYFSSEDIDIINLYGDKLDIVLDKYDEWYESLQALSEIYTKMQEELMELYDNQINRLTKINTLLQGQSTLVGLIGGSLDNSNTIIQNSLYSYQIAIDKANAARDEFEKAQSTKGITKEQLKMLEENMYTAQEAVIKVAQETLGLVVDETINKFKLAIDQVLGDQGFDYLSTEWELNQTLDDRTLDEVNSAYEISKLEREILKSIDNTDSIYAQNKLNELRQKEIDILKQKDKLTQYEVDHANALYDLTLKQIALEEAQQTANKMKLVRDAMGNYTYQYIQDDDAIAQAEEDLAEAENNLYNLNKNEAKERITEVFSLITEGYEKWAELRKQGREEEAAMTYEAYFGSNGFITSLTNSFDLIEENMSKIDKSLEGTEIGKSFEKLSQIDFAQIGSTMQGVYENAETYLSTFANELNDYLGEGSPLISAINNMTDLFDKGILWDEEGKTLVNVAGANTIQNNTSAIINQISISEEVLGLFATKIQTALEEKINLATETTYKQAVDKQVDALDANTQAILTWIDKYENDGETGKVTINNHTYTFTENNGWVFDQDVNK